MEESGVDSLPYLQYTNFLSLSDKESVIVRAVILIRASGKQGEVRAMSFLTKFPH